MFFVLAVIIDQVIIDHFKVVGLVPLPSNECKAEIDLVLTQTSFVFLWKCTYAREILVSMRTTSTQQSCKGCIKTTSTPGPFP